MFDELIDKTCRFKRVRVPMYPWWACAHERVRISMCVDTQKVGKTFEWFLMADDPIGRAPNWARHGRERYLFNYYFDCVSMSVLLCTHVYSWFGCYTRSVYIRGSAYVICCGGKVFCVEVPCMSWRLAWHNYGVLMYRSSMIRLKCVYITTSTPCVCISNMFDECAVVYAERLSGV